MSSKVPIVSPWPQCWGYRLRTCFSCRFWASKFRFLRLCKRHFTDWPTSPEPIKLFSKGKNMCTLKFEKTCGFFFFPFKGNQLTRLSLVYRKEFLASPCNKHVSAFCSNKLMFSTLITELNHSGFLKGNKQQALRPWWLLPWIWQNWSGMGSRYWQSLKIFPRQWGPSSGIKIYCHKFSLISVFFLFHPVLMGENCVFFENSYYRPVRRLPISIFNITLCHIFPLCAMWCFTLDDAN